jgi:hypothetical protein
VRLLHCGACKTLEEIPDYEGSQEVDPLVERVVMEHNRRDPMAHAGKHLTTLPMRLGVVDDMEYAYQREDVLKRFMEEGQNMGMTPWVGETLNTFQEDALKCWNQHRQPKEGSPCIDYMSDSKRIGRPTQEGRDILAQNYKLGAKDPHLCQYCPYHSVVETAIRARKGLYKDK